MKRFVTLLLLVCMTALTLLAAVSCGYKSDVAGGAGEIINCPVKSYDDADAGTSGTAPDKGDKDKPESVRPAVLSRNMASPTVRLICSRTAPLTMKESAAH